MRRPYFAFKIVGVILVVLIVTPISIHFWVQSAEPRRWEDMRTRCRELALAASARETKRPVLRGTPQPGNAWEDYQAALDLVDTASIRSLGTNEDLDKVQHILWTYGPALVLLQRGASRATVSRRIDWESCPPGLKNISPLSSLAAAQAHLHRAAGSMAQATELLLDTAQFGEDLARTGTYIDALWGLSLVSTSVDELKNILVSESLDAELQLEILRGLELLDLGFPRNEDLSPIGTMEFGFELLQAATAQDYLAKREIKGRTLSTWRSGFSERIMMADAFQTSLEWDRVHRETADLPWREVCRRRDGLEAEVAKNRNGLLQVLNEISSKLRDSQRRDGFRERRAQMRLLRMAIRYKTTGEIEPLDDPFGSKLLTRQTGNRLLIWSVGLNGVDDGGIGEWNPGKGKDIVLTVTRTQ